MRLCHFGKVLTNEVGIGMVQVIMLAAFLSLMALYLTSSSTSFQKTMGRMRSKDQIVTDRNILKFDLINRALPPAPGTP